MHLRPTGRATQELEAVTENHGVQWVEVTADQAGQRVDNFLLARLRGVPRSRVYRILRKGEVRVNGGRVRADYRLREGDKVRVPPVRLKSLDPAAPDPALTADIGSRILYEDARLLALDKPSGLAVHGGSGIRHGAIEALRARFPDAPFLELVHRLDRATSGCLLVAKKRSELRRLHALLRENRVDKRYLALVCGAWPWQKKVCTATLNVGGRQGGERHVQVSRDGKPAITDFRLLTRYRDAALVEARLLTGRTHQIRVHAGHLGAPVAGDDRYGDRDINASLRRFGLKRLFLHAASLRFPTGTGATVLRIDSPLPRELARVLERLATAEGGSGERDASNA